MAVPASLRPQRFSLLRPPATALRRLPLEPARERTERYVGEWGSPLRFVAVAVVCGALALLVTLVVLALAVTSSPLWVVILVPCFGLYYAFSGRRRAAVMAAAAAEAESKPA